MSDPDGALARIQATLSAALARGGWYAPESRPFLAHVTVARVAAKGGRFRPAPSPAPPAVEVRCSRVTLYRSRLGSAGARYEPQATVELGSAPGAADPVSVVRRFHAEQARLYAGAAGDAGLRDLLAEDVVWHVPGASAIAGEHRGVDARAGVHGRAPADHGRDLPASTVHGAAMIAGRVVQLAGGTAMRDGREVALGDGRRLPRRRRADRRVLADPLRPGGVRSDLVVRVSGSRPELTLTGRAHLTRGRLVP